MSDAKMTGWTKLRCGCGSQEFLSKVTLNWRDGGGTNESPAGYQCRQCDADVDAAALIRLAQLAAKKAELKALTEELGEEAAPKAPAEAAKK